MTIETDLENYYQDPQVEEVLNKEYFSGFKSLSFLPEVEKRSLIEESAELRQEFSAIESKPQHKI